MKLGDLFLIIFPEMERALRQKENVRLHNKTSVENPETKTQQTSSSITFKLM